MIMFCCAGPRWKIRFGVLGRGIREIARTREAFAQFGAKLVEDAAVAGMFVVVGVVVVVVGVAPSFAAGRGEREVLHAVA